jgi:hypothetical protein
VGDFPSFRKFITPMFIQAFFWVLVVVAVLSAFAMMFQGTASGVLMGLIWLVLGPVLARIYCEILILLFRIYDELVAMRTGVPPAGTQPGFPVYPSGPAQPPVPPPVG